jgi:hypothetical protein
MKGSTCIFWAALAALVGFYLVAVECIGMPGDLAKMLAVTSAGIGAAAGLRHGKFANRQR